MSKERTRAHDRTIEGQTRQQAAYEVWGAAQADETNELLRLLVDQNAELLAAVTSLTERLNAVEAGEGR